MNQQMQKVDKIHSDLQRLVLGGPVEEISEVPEVANSSGKDDPLKHEPASDQE